jgi:hypothetical protein
MRLFAPAVVIASMCLGFALTPARTDAQFTSSLGGNFNNPGSALIGTMIANRAIADAARREAPADATAPAARGRAAAPARTTFRPVAKHLMVRELAASITNDAAARSQFVTIFEQYLQAFDEQARKDREPSYDVGRAAAYFVMMNYAVASGREVTDQQADGAQAKFRAGLAENAGFQQMANSGRQRLYETLVILGSLPTTGVGDAAEKKDPKQAEMFRELAGQYIQTLLGVPVGKIRLTPTGFVIED